MGLLLLEYAMNKLQQFHYYSKGMLQWRNWFVPAEPHLELIPWLALFRPLERTMWHMIKSYPEDAYWLRI